ncbi:hypothetical protein N2152v2_003484 [Parachlorella kessleri]
MGFSSAAGRLRCGSQPTSTALESYGQADSQGWEQGLGAELLESQGMEASSPAVGPSLLLPCSLVGSYPKEGPASNTSQQLTLPSLFRFSPTRPTISPDARQTQGSQAKPSVAGGVQPAVARGGLRSPLEDKSNSLLRPPTAAAAAEGTAGGLTPVGSPGSLAAALAEAGEEPGGRAASQAPGTTSPSKHAVGAVPPPAAEAARGALVPPTAAAAVPPTAAVTDRQLWAQQQEQQEDVPPSSQEKAFQHSQPPAGEHAIAGALPPSQQQASSTAHGSTVAAPVSPCQPTQLVPKLSPPPVVARPSPGPVLDVLPTQRAALPTQPVWEPTQVVPQPPIQAVQPVRAATPLPAPEQAAVPPTQPVPLTPTELGVLPPLYEVPELLPTQVVVPPTQVMALPLTLSLVPPTQALPDSGGVPQPQQQPVEHLAGAHTGVQPGLRHVQRQPGLAPIGEGTDEEGCEAQGTEVQRHAPYTKQGLRSGGDAAEGAARRAAAGPGLGGTGSHAVSPAVGSQQETRRCAAADHGEKSCASLLEAVPAPPLPAEPPGQIAELSGRPLTVHQDSDLNVVDAGGSCWRQLVDTGDSLLLTGDLTGTRPEGVKLPAEVAAARCAWQASAAAQRQGDAELGLASVVCAQVVAEACRALPQDWAVEESDRFQWVVWREFQRAGLHQLKLGEGQVCGVASSKPTLEHSPRTEAMLEALLCSEAEVAARRQQLSKQGRVQAGSSTAKDHPGSLGGELVLQASRAAASSVEQQRRQHQQPEVSPKQGSPHRLAQAHLTCLARPAAGIATMPGGGGGVSNGVDEAPMAPGSVADVQPCRQASPPVLQEPTLREVANAVEVTAAQPGVDGLPGRGRFCLARGGAVLGAMGAQPGSSQGASLPCGGACPVAAEPGKAALRRAGQQHPPQQQTQQEQQALPQPAGQQGRWSVVPETPQYASAGAGGDPGHQAASQQPLAAPLPPLDVTPGLEVVGQPRQGQLVVPDSEDLARLQPPVGAVGLEPLDKQGFVAAAHLAPTRVADPEMAAAAAPQGEGLLEAPLPATELPAMSKRCGSEASVAVARCLPCGVAAEPPAAMLERQPVRHHHHHHQQQQQQQQEQKKEDKEDQLGRACERPSPKLSQCPSSPTGPSFDCPATSDAHLLGSGAWGAPGPAGLLPIRQSQGVAAAPKALASRRRQRLVQQGQGRWAEGPAVAAAEAGACPRRWKPQGKRQRGDGSDSDTSAGEPLQGQAQRSWRGQHGKHGGRRSQPSSPQVHWPAIEAGDDLFPALRLAAGSPPSAVIRAAKPCQDNTLLEEHATAVEAARTEHNVVVKPARGVPPSGRKRPPGEKGNAAAVAGNTAGVGACKDGALAVPAAGPVAVAAAVPRRQPAGEPLATSAATEAAAAAAGQPVADPVAATRTAPAAAATPATATALATAGGAITAAAAAEVPGVERVAGALPGHGEPVGGGAGLTADTRQHARPASRAAAQQPQNGREVRAQQPTHSKPSAVRQPQHRRSTGAQRPQRAATKSPFQGLALPLPGSGLLDEAGPPPLRLQAALRAARAVEAYTMPASTAADELELAGGALAACEAAGDPSHAPVSRPAALAAAGVAVEVWQPASSSFEVAAAQQAAQQPEALGEAEWHDSGGLCLARAAPPIAEAIQVTYLVAQQAAESDPGATRSPAGKRARVVCEGEQPCRQATRARRTEAAGAAPGLRRGTSAATAGLAAAGLAAAAAAAAAAGTVVVAGALRKGGAARAAASTLEAERRLDGREARACQAAAPVPPCFGPSPGGAPPSAARQAPDGGSGGQGVYWDLCVPHGQACMGQPVAGGGCVQDRSHLRQRQGPRACKGATPQLYDAGSQDPFRRAGSKA